MLLFEVFKMKCKDFYVMNDTLYPETKITLCCGKCDIDIKAENLLLPVYANREVTNFGVDYVRIL